MRSRLSNHIRDKTLRKYGAGGVGRGIASRRSFLAARASWRLYRVTRIKRIYSLALKEWRRGAAGGQAGIA
jgi:hypothetical protein